MGDEVLSNVKIIEVERTEVVGYSLFGNPVKKRIDKPDDNWTVVYNVHLKSWIVTNEPVSHGLNAAAEELQLIGFGETLNAALFIVWDHQTSLGLDWTIQDELKKLHRQLVYEADTREWEWPK